jgi:cytosine/adenosine deaminase-related metal-dependent hydrolase
MLESEGFVRPGVVIDHGLALSRQDFQSMARMNVGLVWSPRSNISLYGVTTDVLAAKQEGVTTALSPDWSPSGSDGMLEELKYAATWNAGQVSSVFDDSDLVKMATTIPAALAGVGDKIGSLREGFYADVLVIKGEVTLPFHQITHSDPVNVRLVVVNGMPLYGDLDLMNRLLPGNQVESLRICGSDKGLHLNGGGISWKQAVASLNSALNSWGTQLSELFPCQGTNQN